MRRVAPSTAPPLRPNPSFPGGPPDARRGRGAFAPRLLASADEDAPLVPLARQQDGVTRTGATDRMRDPLPAILDPRVLLTLGPADLLGPRGNLAEDGHGVLFTRVFIGENGIVTQAGGDLPHPGPLLAIAVTRAAEDGDQLPSRDRAQLTKDFLETLRRMRVIDDHADRLAEVDPLHPDADAAINLQSLTDLVEFQPACLTRGAL